MNRALAILFIGLGFYCQAQSTDIIGFFKSDLQKAELLFESGVYPNAIELYQRVLEKNPNEFRAKLRIAESYRMMGVADSTVKYYAQVIDQQDIIVAHYYYYAEALASTGNYQEASYWYQEYAKEVRNDPRPLRKIEFIDKINYYQRDSSLYFIDHIPINSIESDFAAVPVDDILIFLSGRDHDLFVRYIDSEGSEETTQARFDLFYSVDLDTGFSMPEPYNKELNTRFHEGPITFFHNSDKVIFTRNNFYKGKKATSKDGQIKLNMYITRRDKENNYNWTDFKPFPYDNDDYSTGHPSISYDDKTLFFSSDMPGGYGGSDLYYSKWENDRWTEPVNLGDQINTLGDEMFPFIAHDNMLYFASNGHGGFGGLDIFQAYPEGNLFSRVENLGYPLNTSSDDFAFTLNKNSVTGYISSNRPGGIGGDDIYRYKRRFLQVVGTVIDTKRNEPVAGADIVIMDSTQNKQILKKTDENGQFRVDLLLDSRFSMKAYKEGYSPQGYSLVSSSGKQFITDTIEVNMWKHTLFAEGRVFSNETQSILKGSRVTIQDLTDDSVRTKIIGADSTYFFVLESDKSYQVTAEMSDHITRSFILNTEGLDEDTLRNDFLLEEMYRDKDIVFFDFDAAELRPKTIASLNEMIRILKKHPETSMVISAHADAQGSFEYNKDLSDRRALALVGYLKSKGISNTRITWRGFGEELLLNRCSDGVECPQEDHSLNRRAELKIEEKKLENPFETAKDGEK